MLHVNPLALKIALTPNFLGKYFSLIQGRLAYQSTFSLTEQPAPQSAM